MQVAEVPGLLSQVIPLRSYREARSQFFPSSHALDWFVRQHKARLVQAGALMLMRGAWHVHSERFDQAVVEIAGDDAKAWVERGQRAA